jgi:hypothetical protein
MDPFQMVVAIVAIGGISKIGLAAVNMAKREAEVKLRTKELEVEALRHETKLLELKEREIPTWLDGKDPEEVRRWKEAHQEVSELLPPNVPKRLTS